MLHMNSTDDTAHLIVLIAKHITSCDIAYKNNSLLLHQIQINFTLLTK